MILRILFEDDDLLVVNKPAGLVCHPTRDGEMSSLVGRVRLYLGHGEGRLVNRLDRETSGVVLIAKRAAVAGELGRLIASTAGMRKQYWAVVHGHLGPEELTVDAPLGRDDKSAVAIKDRVRADGVPARTHLSVLHRFVRTGDPYTWLDVRPETGRKHQIRIHLAHIGHPVAGDKIYGRDERIYLRFVAGAMTDDDRSVLKLENQVLHARRLSFTWRGRDWQFDAEPDSDFETWIR
jgi:23S rRNA pseudouridine1911/1915/1917 synthase